MISFTSRGSFKNAESFIKHASKVDILGVLNSYAQEGVTALANATPIESGLASSSWDYEVAQRKGAYSITWINTDVENGFSVAIMLQYGYATGTGGYVQGEDYINPAMRPIFDKIADKVWKAVTTA